MQGQIDAGGAGGHNGSDFEIILVRFGSYGALLENMVPS